MAPLKQNLGYLPERNASLGRPFNGGTKKDQKMTSGGKQDLKRGSTFNRLSSANQPAAKGGVWRNNKPIPQRKEGFSGADSRY